MEEFKMDDTLINTGIELLMNDTQLKTKPSSSVDFNLGEIDALEKDLNTISTSLALDDFTNFGSGSNFQMPSKAKPKTTAGPGMGRGMGGSLGSATAYSNAGVVKSRDGFAKLTGIPADIAATTVRDKKKKKAQMLRVLHTAYEAGGIRTRIDTNASYEDIEDEYQSAEDEKRDQKISLLCVIIIPYVRQETLFQNIVHVPHCFFMRQSRNVAHTLFPRRYAATRVYGRRKCVDEMTVFLRVQKTRGNYIFIAPNSERAKENECGNCRAEFGYVPHDRLILRHNDANLLDLTTFVL
jgi:hypothetical protein